MTRVELLQRMSSRELSEWMAYYAVEPWGEVQAEYRSALVASMVANTARDPEKRKSPFEAEEFMRPSYIGTRKEEPESLMDKARAIFGLMGARKQ